MSGFVGMRIVDPVTVTDTVLVDSNVVENDYAAYNPATGYTTGQRCIVDHAIYESVMTTANTGNAPATSPTKWKKVSATNRYKMFDTVNSTASFRASPLSVQLRPKAAVNTVSLSNIAGATRVRIRAVDPVAGSVYDKTQFLTGVLPRSSWYDFFFAPRIPAVDVLATDLPAYPNADVLIDLVDGAGGEVAVGTCLIGQTVEVGDGVRFGVKVGIQDYSRQTVNDYGDLVLNVGAYAKRASFPLRIPNQYLDVVQMLFARMRSKPVLFIGYEPYKCTVVFGIYKSFEILIGYATFSDCNVDLLGLT